ncbi:MAG TPA: efflux RND transporter periplasmic adaptor subunit [Xanthomonadales bacterium]|nr:efflux RND transporter periplasmic adaptor subunit [Xanthomonadales bacterium]
MNNQSELLNQLRIDRSAETPSGSRGWLVGGIATALLVAAGVVAWAMTREQPAVVRVEPARAAAGIPQSASVLDATGYVTARRQATVSAKITGKVRDVRIEEGQRVAENEVLATLDDTEAQASLALYRAQLDAARAQVAENRTQLANAQREEDRARELAGRKLVSASALDAATTQAETWKARLASAERGVAVAQESVRVAEVQLDNTIVRAPFAGVVTVKAAQPGEMISPISAGGGFTRTGIGTIVDMDSLEVQVDVNESYINRVKPGQPVDAFLNAYPDMKIPASVIAIIPTADRSKATVKVRIKLEQKDERVVPDMGVRVAFLEDAKPVASQSAPAQRGVLVPASAIRKEGERDVLFVLRDDKAERRAVTVGGNIGEAREVKAGVRAGESVIVEGPADLRDGQEVEVAK